MSVRSRIGSCLTMVMAFLCMRGLPAQHPLPVDKLAHEFFGEDASWYRDNIPFLDISDADIERTYYYRWQVYRSHLREIGPHGTDETEFLPDVPWARHPYEDLNDSSSFHILEGRWLRNPAFVASLVDHLYSGAGNDRHFSESNAAATLAWTEVTGDPAPALRHLDSMQYVFNLWDDHFDARRGLYWIEPLLDATEYTISSIDASGAGFGDPAKPGDDGFFGGFAFRPSINAYQFGNAQAIAALARLAGEPDVADEYTRRAETLRTAMLQQLWNPGLEHFTDIYQRSTRFVTAGDFIRGRELVGFVPWQFEVPPQSPQANAPEYNLAWKHILSSSELAGAYGLRTVEPSYVRYLTQYRYDKSTGLPECQWNGPSWPFQTSQALSALANLLQDYDQSTVSATDYVHLLRQYTRQHRLPSGVMDIQEDYNPDIGRPIVGLPRSHHYNHSTYVDLVLSGLLGIRPRLDDLFEMHPLLPRPGSSEAPIRYFALDRLRYHGHELTLVYDADGTRYHLGSGLSIACDGKWLLRNAPLGRIRLPLPKPAVQAVSRPRTDLAVNVWAQAPSAFQPDLPIAMASSTAPDSSLYDPLDGRLWFLPEIAHGWSPAPQTTGGESWYSLDLRAEKLLGAVELAFFADGKDFSAPAGVRLQMQTATGWTDVPQPAPVVPLGNSVTRISFKPFRAQHIRLLLNPSAGKRFRLIAFRVFAPAS